MKKYLFILLILLTVGVGCNNTTESGEQSLSKYNGWKLVQKEKVFRYPDSVYRVWLQREDEIKEVRTVIYWIDKYNVGDTIK